MKILVIFHLPAVRMTVGGFVSANTVNCTMLVTIPNELLAMAANSAPLSATVGLDRNTCALPSCALAPGTFVNVMASPVSRCHSTNRGNAPVAPIENVTEVFSTTVTFAGGVSKPAGPVGVIGETPL